VGRKKEDEFSRGNNSLLAGRNSAFEEMKEI
jgi:hypothetical protein